MASRSSRADKARQNATDKAVSEGLFSTDLPEVSAGGPVIPSMFPKGSLILAYRMESASRTGDSSVAPASVSKRTASSVSSTSQYISTPAWLPVTDFSSLRSDSELPYLKITVNGDQQGFLSIWHCTLLCCFKVFDRINGRFSVLTYSANNRGYVAQSVKF
jgi:hypothetical protein